MRYSLRQLEVFLAVAHHQNITRAADELAMSQSAASSALKELEGQFDIQLFDRVGKRLQLNELGKALRPQAEALMAKAGELEQAFMEHSQLGNLNIGATLTIGNYLAVDIISRYMKAEPEAKISLQVANTEQIAKQVLNFELDLALVEGEINHPDLQVTPWREDEMVVFCAPEHTLASKPKLTDKELLAAQWILREQGSGTRQAFDRAMHGLLPELDVTLELQHTEAIKRAVAANMGLSCLSRETLADEFFRGSLKPLATPGRAFRRTYYFVLHKQKYLSAGIEKFIDYCRHC